MIHRNICDLLIYHLCYNMVQYWIFKGEKKAEFFKAAITAGDLGQIQVLFSFWHKLS